MPVSGSKIRSIFFCRTCSKFAARNTPGILASNSAEKCYMYSNLSREKGTVFGNPAAAEAMSLMSLMIYGCMLFNLLMAFSISAKIFLVKFPTFSSGAPKMPILNKPLCSGEILRLEKTLEHQIYAHMVQRQMLQVDLQASSKITLAQVPFEVIYNHLNLYVSIRKWGKLPFFNFLFWKQRILAQCVTFSVPVCSPQLFVLRQVHRGRDGGRR